MAAAASLFIAALLLISQVHAPDPDGQRRILAGSRGHGFISLAPTPAPAPAPEQAPSVDRHRVRNWVLGFIAGAATGIITGLVLTFIFRLFLNCIRGRYRRPSGPSIFSPLIKGPKDLAFLSKEDGLAAFEIIGRGGCGEVYRAPLPGDPTRTIAIKKIKKLVAADADANADLTLVESRLLDKQTRQIRSEILTVGRIRHRNLLPLLAHVPRPDCSFLVYEFMKNGSLHDAIVGNNHGLELDWLARHRMATGIAAGLDYLHHQHSPRIIHRDLKPANILIDDMLEARISDFGLAKEMPDGNTHMSLSNVAGTAGYFAPEYHQTFKFSTKCDIYSLGVILTVLVMGKLPSDDFFQETEEMSMVKWLRNVMGSGDMNLGVVIDDRLSGQGYEEQMVLVLRIACFCTADDPKDRPTSKDVRCMLSQIKYQQ